ncbi:cation diffusion facilitator family transporter [Pararhizobium haloflavum]|jgi:cobalt-zinc-cadmium efflux system protein|uniref:cation diffusion facilitator family transporter n=1 Tax=Pararhizobium haloflavum TaxID=2037914 RepID=UPI000C190E92|nr:cation diffusion facilitator family transporter [Pararhizobium haloflavum]
MAGHHHDHGAAEAGDRRVFWAIVVNLVLTTAQIIGGLVSGSLSLLADAIHNLSDAMALVIAFGARRIARRPADRTMTWGYGRAEAVAALINYTTLIVIGAYLVYEGVMRLIEPQPVGGWIVVVVAGIALAVDTATALLTYALSKKSMNIRAAFLHNVADALGSIGVIVAGTLIILYDWRIVDPIVTLLIAAYILWQSFVEIGGSIRLLMMGTPENIDMDALLAAVRSVEGVENLHHVHLWAVTETTNAFEAHVVTGGGPDGEILNGIRAVLTERFDVVHANLQFETADAACENAPTIGHSERRPETS